MYEPICQSAGFSKVRFGGGFDPALTHSKPIGYTLDFNAHHCHLSHSVTKPNWPKPDEYLLGRMTDRRTLMAACDRLLRNGPKTAGPNGGRLEHYSRLELGRLCKTLSKAISDGTYRPGPVKTIRIPKVGKPGKTRCIAVQNIEDRIVSKAALEVLQPFVSPRLSPLTFGVNRAGREDALVAALSIAEATGRWSWVSDDVESAFDRIPFNRCMDACLSTGLPDAVVDHLRLIAGTGRKRGVLQGAPVSMLLASIFYHHHLDRFWPEGHPACLLLRYVDDLLVLCLSPGHASNVYPLLSKRLTAIGTPLKGNATSSIFDLAAGATIEWLGYRIRQCDGRADVTVADAAWRSLETRLETSHRSASPPLHAISVVTGWIQALGPCFEAEDHDAVVGRLASIAKNLAFDEVPASDDLLTMWAAAAERWEHKLEVFDVSDAVDRLQTFQS